MIGNHGRFVIINLFVVLCILLFLYPRRDAWTAASIRLVTGQAHSLEPISSSGLKEDPLNNGAITLSLSPGQAACLDLPGADKVLVMLKTGATEIYQKLPIHLVTTFRCTPSFMIFSDLDQDFGEVRIHDTIAPVHRNFREQHTDFELYRKLQEYQREGQDVSNLQGDGSWNLDKWKFLPMLCHAFANAADGIEWFVVIEADTSLSWMNLLQWLKTMNPRRPIYTGAQNLIDGVPFAHGGSGIVISRKAAQLLEQHREEEGKDVFDQRWEFITSKSCCGDEILARVFLEVGIDLTPAWPLIQGETISSLDWTSKHWCAPAVSWHHVSPCEINALWLFENAWIRNHGPTPYLYRDVFEQFVEHHVTINRTKWNNLSQHRKLARAKLATAQEEDVSQLGLIERSAVGSENACAKACMEMHEDDCIQWMYSPGRCYLGNAIRFGESDERKLTHWTSGWVNERLERFKARFAHCSVSWPS